MLEDTEGILDDCLYKKTLKVYWMIVYVRRHWRYTGWLFI